MSKVKKTSRTKARATGRAPQRALIIQTKRSPPIWSIKVGLRYSGGFMGGDAKERALVFARENFDKFDVIEMPSLKRERDRLVALTVSKTDQRGKPK